MLKFGHRRPAAPPAVDGRAVERVREARAELNNAVKKLEHGRSQWAQVRAELETMTANVRGGDENRRG